MKQKCILLSLSMALLFSCKKEKPLKPATKQNSISSVFAENRQWTNNPNGTTILKVAFLDEISADLRSFIIEYANEWSKHCNVKFVPFHASSADITIRIKFSDLGSIPNNADNKYYFTQTKPGYIAQGYSKVGAGNFLVNTYYTCMAFFRGIGTMNLQLDNTFKKMASYNLRTQFHLKHTILHEFGHALGFEHAHFHPEFQNRIIDRDALYKLYEQSGIPMGVVDQNIFGKKQFGDWNSGESYSSTFDNKSIMNYTIPFSFYEIAPPYIWRQILANPEDGIEITDRLSEDDKLVARKKYPFPTKRPEADYANLKLTLFEQSL